MRGDNHLLAVTTVTDEATGEVKPLFSFPIQICKATETAKTPFEVAAPSGSTRTQVYRDDATGEIVEDADCPRGVRVGDKFVPIPDEAITEVKGVKTNMIVTQGVEPLSNIDFTRSEGRYYVQTPAKGGSAKAYRLLYEGLREIKGKGGKVEREARALVAKRTPRTNEKLIVIFPDEQAGCLVAVQLCYAGLMREPDAQVLSHQQAQVQEAQIAKVVAVLDTLPSGAGFIAEAQDDNLPRQIELVEKAMMGEAITAPEPIKETVQTDDLEALLEASLAAAA